MEPGEKEDYRAKRKEEKAKGNRRRNKKKTTESKIKKADERGT